MVRKVEQKFSLKIKDIKTVKFSIDNTVNLNNNTDFNFNINSMLIVDKENKLVGFDIHITITPKINENDIFAEIKTRNLFEVLNFDEIIKEKNDGLEIPDQIIETLNSISISTTRGILTAKTEGTILQNVFLPLVNPKAFKKR